MEDPAFEKAYETVSPARKALVKTALALAFAFAGDSRLSRRTSRRLFADGFGEIYRSEPAEAAAIVFPDDFGAAARICAAAAAPALAGVRRIFALSLGSDPRDEILATLELCGVEDVFRVTPANLSRFRDEFCEDPRVRALFLGGVATVPGRYFYAEKREPVLALVDPEIFNPEDLLFATGTLPPRGAEERADAVYLSVARAESDEFPAPLRLTPGCEGYWRFLDMPPDFFRVHSLTLFPDIEGGEPGRDF